MEDLKLLYILHIVIWVNCNDLTGTEPWESWLIRKIIPKWPEFRLVNYYDLPIIIYNIYDYTWWSMHLHKWYILYKLYYTFCTHVWIVRIDKAKCVQHEFGISKYIYKFHLLLQCWMLLAILGGRAIYGQLGTQPLFLIIERCSTLAAKTAVVLVTSFQSMKGVTAMAWCEQVDRSVNKTPLPTRYSQFQWIHD